jgi:hypothetical protein
MAVIAVMAGGMLGFFCATFTLLTLDISWLAMLGIWWSVGSLIAIALLAFVLSPRLESQSGLTNERA